jgi:hypothetical protein
MFHQKLIVAQLFNRSFAFYGTQTFIAVFTTVGHRSVSCARRIQSTTSHTTYLRFIFYCTFTCTYVSQSLSSTFSDEIPVRISHSYNSCCMSRLSYPSLFRYQHKTYKVYEVSDWSACSSLPLHVHCRLYTPAGRTHSGLHELPNCTNKLFRLYLLPAIPLFFLVVYRPSRTKLMVPTGQF